MITAVMPPYGEVRMQQRQLRVIGDSWLLTICAMVMATAVPWFLAGIAVDFRATARCIFGVGAVYMLMTAQSSQSRQLAVLQQRLPNLWQAAGTIGVGLVWWYAGGLQNPVFLLVFVLPILSAGLLSTLMAYLTAVLSILIVVAIALKQAPELRWYLAENDPAAAWLAALFDGRGGKTELFSGFYAPAGYAVLLLEVSMVALIACAVAAGIFGGMFRKSLGDVVTAHSDAARAQDLWLELIESLPVPAVLVEADTLKIVAHSRSLLAASSDRVSIPSGGDLFCAVNFSHPEIVQELISAGGEVLPFCAMRVGKQLRAAEVRVQRLTRATGRFALVVINDITEHYCMQAALDAAEYASLVIDANGKIVGFNRPALGLLSGLDRGVEAASLLKDSVAGTLWWQPQLGGRRKLHVEIGQRQYQMSCSTIALPGEEAPLSVVAITPAAATNIFYPKAAAPSRIGNGLPQ